MATIGEQLLTPEDGWRRIDNTNSSIVYTGTWGSYGGTSYYNNTLYSSNTLGDSYSFKFYGTKFRIISQYYTNRTSEQTVVIDDSITETYTGNNSPANIVLEYEKTDLTEGIHTVTVTNTGNGGGYGYMPIDAIDIDEDGYMIAPDRNIGDSLTGADDTWQRIDTTRNELIHYEGLWYAWSNSGCYNSSSVYTVTGSAKFKFYGTKVRVYNRGGSDNSTSAKIVIDDTEYSYDGTAYVGNFQSLMAQSIGLTEGVHTVTISNNNSTGYVFFDCLDIDSNGYLIEFADEGDIVTDAIDGYTRIDINSESLVDGIVLSKTDSTSDWQTETNNNYYNNTNCYTNTNGAKATIYFHGTDFMLIGGYNSSLYSNDISISIDGGTIETISENKDLSYKTLIYQAHDLEDIDHVITITNNTNSTLVLDAIDINDTGYLYKPLTSNYILIKQNDNYYSFDSSNYDTTTKMYKTVSLSDDATNFSKDLSTLFTSTTINGETFKPIDKFKNDTFKIVANYKLGDKLKIYGRKTNSSMLVPKNSFSTAVADTIKYFTLEGSDVVKVIVSPSDGNWYTYNGGTWVDLGLTIPSNNYTDLTTDELTQWNTAKSTILSQGINYSDLKKCNFSTLTNTEKTLKFAYVIYNSAYGGGATIKSLSWSYSKSGKLKMCKDSEYDIELTNNGAIITSLIDTDIMKIITHYEKVGEN